MGQRPMTMPYAVQRTKPVDVTAYIPSEMAPASFSRQIFISWGAKLAIEQIAAAMPNALMISGVKGRPDPALGFGGAPSVGSGH